MTVIKICLKRALKVIALSHTNKAKRPDKKRRKNSLARNPKANAIVQKFKRTNLNYNFVFLVFGVILDSVDLLQSFIKLTACPNDLLRSQGAMLKYLHIISSDLTQVYDAVKLR